MRIIDNAMTENREKKIRLYIKVIKITTVLLGIITIIGGVILAGVMADKLLKENPDGSLEIKSSKVDAMKSFFGTELQELNDIIKEQLDVTTTQGVLVSSVIEGSPADDAGIEQGDVIVRFNRQKVEDVGQLQELVADTSPNDTVKVVLERNRKTKTLYIRLTTSPTATNVVSQTAYTQTIAGNADNRVELCICPVCGTTVGHPAGLACSDLLCPYCGNRLISYNTVQGIAQVTAGTAEQGIVPISNKPDTFPPTDRGEGADGDGASGSMKVAIASQGKKLTSEIATMFDKSPYYIIAELASFEAVRNPYIHDLGDVGILSAQFVVDKGVEAVIADNISLQAVNELSHLNVKLFSGISGTVSEALEWYMSNRLQETTVRGVQ